MNDSATPRPIFMTWFILTIPKTFFAMHACSRKGEHSREVERGKSQSLKGGVMRRRCQLTAQYRS
jgi:hypothetical protein